MNMRDVVRVVLPLLVGAGIGGGSTYQYLRHRGTGAEEPHRARITLARDSCCPAEGPGAKETPGEQAGHSEGEAGHTDEVKLAGDAVKRLGIQTAEARGGRLVQTLSMPGEIILNSDRVATIVPRVSGMVRQVNRSVGDRVKAGDVLAVLESRELAEAKAADLAAETRLKLAESNHKRIEGLFQQKIAPERQYHEAVQGLEEARVAHRETVAKLHALGLTHEQVTGLGDEDQASLGLYELKAPFDGTLIDRRVTLGEVHSSGSPMFVLADLTTVWAEVTVYSQDAPRIATGAKVRIRAAASGASPEAAEGTLFYLSPILREATRTAHARALIDNRGGQWRPGMFITAEIVTGTDEVAVAVPAEAIQTVEGEPAVFWAEDECCFQKRVVKPGRTDGNLVEIVSGLQAGERYVSKGAFVLKAELSKGEGGHEH